MKCLLPLLLVILVVLPSAFSQEDLDDSTVFFDQPVASDMAIEFEIEEDLYPDRSSFRIKSFAFLSNERGERWALVNLHNTAITPRSISPNQIYGLFADGSYRQPIRLSQRVDGGKTQSVLIPFGKSKLPLVKLIVRQN